MTRTLIHAIILNADEYDEGLTFDDAGCGDYIYHALFDYESDRCIYHQDNIHGDPETFLDGLIVGVEITGDDIEMVEALIFLNDDELDSNYLDVCAALRRWIDENMD